MDQRLLSEDSEMGLAIRPVQRANECSIQERERIQSLIREEDDDQVDEAVLNYISQNNIIGKQQNFINHLFEAHQRQQSSGNVKIDSLPAGIIILLMTYLMVVLSLDNGFDEQTRKYLCLKIFFYVFIAAILYFSKLLPLGSISNILMVRWFPMSYILSLLIFGNTLVNIIVSIMMLNQRYDRALQEVGQILLLFILIFPTKFEINLGFMRDDLLGIFAEINGTAYITFWDSFILHPNTCSIIHKVFVALGFLLSVISTVLIAFDDRGEYVITVIFILLALSTICGILFWVSRKSVDKTAYEILALFILFVCIDLSIAHELK
jgi:hypothetical protein